MEPLELTVVGATWALQKVAEGSLANLGEKVIDQGTRLWKLLKDKSPQTAAALEKPLDYGEAVLELEAAVKADPDIAEAVLEVEAAVKAYPECYAQVLQAVTEANKPGVTVTENWKGINIKGGTQTFSGPINI
ncbi:hypothetical protein [Oscillatoria sp. HE19RPO]|uniref:hypothetical protein n=1 Tax=Oscillatoria sp. HE19RPO TaxID=2954806 RepID=UPI0020C308F6|nr:hypothetical protein [Oscillatoria sp. HE19RPO]